ncbi:glutamine--fructose-6-phosphate transaminase (isomerizing) [Candidatus Magnetaquicoccus inordinatus]|uniref:glutamine--fructose-6-phosphate transaminase (isomerizing) n=1 Tax=Candidatus Magnetaquicoccus inordinatus TaxID=2496818 RepID=UPI00102C465D|nr:glutamine--fructose-6-phosphate transaminase (isomerizing) [Candidatus Magnetaquicoccus inordinatus]
MCGIIGVIGERNATSLLVEGLKRLEYRGYDSAGIAVLQDSHLQLARVKGKLIRLEEYLADSPCSGPIGIGHTRWATHGPPTQENAHPHTSARVAVVHNGIIENYQHLRQQLQEEGVHFQSATDTEVVPHLIERALKQGLSAADAVRAAVRQLEGAFALGILIRGEECLFAVRRGSPLLVGVGDGENFIASDASPLVPYTRKMIFLQDNDVVLLSRETVIITDLQGTVQNRPIKYSQVSAAFTDKWPYRHYMQKEIFEQPTVLGETLKGLIDAVQRTVCLEDTLAHINPSAVQAINIVACGTSWHAGLVARYWLEQLAHIPVNVDIASEYRYREPPTLPGVLVIVISQSGETADTLAALRYAQQQGQPVLAVVNVPESTIAREADGVLYTQAGPEIGVASTKAFTTQLLALACLTVAFAKERRQIDSKQEAQWVEELLHIPALMEQVLLQDDAILAIARRWMHAPGFLFLGRGTTFPVALEGALKLKEITYIHAEGYAAGEMKHGPIALIDEHLPVVVLAPRGILFDKVISNLQEAKARGGRLLLLTTVGTDPVAEAEVILNIPPSGLFATPIVYVAPLQLLAYHIAVLKGTDVDQPRNLAKSVTVE